MGCWQGVLGGGVTRRLALVACEAPSPLDNSHHESAADHAADHADYSKYTPDYTPGDEPLRRELAGEARLRERQLLHFGWRTVRVPLSEWVGLGEADAPEVAQRRREHLRRRLGREGLDV